MSDPDFKRMKHKAYYYYPDESFAEARRHIDQAQGQSDEMHRWFDRIDEAIDTIASDFGLEAPYSIPGRDWRYNPAARLEHLAEALRSISVVGLERGQR